ncbi:MAG: type I restriction enzyme endonuclease domain-containing protein [Cyanobium sp.]
MTSTPAAPSGAPAPAVALSAGQAKELVQRLKNLLVLNWQQKESARAQLKLLIEDALDLGLPRAYNPELYQQKCAAIFTHVELAYPDAGQSVYWDGTPYGHGLT